MDASLPLEFIDELTRTLGAEQALALAKALDTEPVVGVRLNPMKSGVAPTDAQRVPWCEQGYILSERPRFTLMPSWHGGCFYVQEPASMIISEVIKHVARLIGLEDVKYLDLCAAPGGKTTAALSALPNSAFVVANEFVPARANILAENLTKWGYPNIAVSCGDTAAYRKLKHAFDIVAVDAPCSGEGMMRKDEQARSQWSPALVKQCAALQREILDNAWEALRPGGYLIYSTCTFNRDENEDMLRYAINEYGGESVDLGLNDEFNIPGSIEANLYALRFMPHLTNGEGLFLGVLRKPDDKGATRQSKSKGKVTRKAENKLPVDARSLLSNPDDFNFAQTASGIWRALPKSHASFINKLSQAARLLIAGVTLGEVKGKNFVPGTSLALSTALLPEAFPRVEVDEQTALSYLRREALSLPTDSPKGYVVICSGGDCLGFAKNLGNRANNLYPAHWRIRNI
ncbi:MAG: rRNA cytosine-C5-methyltransferase [Prevotella sp.]|nr:rRNA cytosine-C5-methyltransferase [Prevotella sp.]MCM1074835.1 hypothetical protein [Ruminococcus sp.]